MSRASFASATCLKAAFARPAKRIRVTAQLIDAAGGGHLWAERFDRALDDIFAVQDEITRSIIGALALSLAPESVHSIDGATRSIEAYDLFLKGREFAWRMTRTAQEQAKPLLEKAIALDPGFARAYAILGHVYGVDSLNRWNDDPAADERRGFEFAEKAIQLNPFDPHGYWVVAGVRLWRKEFDVALALAQQVLAIDPSFSAAFATLGGALIGLGRAEEALSSFDTVRQRDPLAPTIMLHYRARALFRLGRFEEAEMSLKERIAKSSETDVRAWSARATPAAGALLRTGGPIGQINILRSVVPERPLATVGNDRAALSSAGRGRRQRFDCLLRRLLPEGGQFLGLLADRRGAFAHVRTHRLDEVRRRPDRHQLLRQLHVGLGVRLKGLQKLRLVFLYRLERTREGAAIEVGGVCELGRHAIADFGRSRGRVIVVRSHVFSSTQALQRRSVHRRSVALSLDAHRHAHA